MATPPPLTHDRVTLQLLLIGKTGHGKSASGNSILGRKEFKTASNSSSSTQNVTEAWASFGQYDVKVIDGPGLEDTNLNEVEDREKACENMAKALMLCNGGIDAFLLVLKFGDRFTKEERKVVTDLRQIFGEEYFKNYGIVIITRGDTFHDTMTQDGTAGKSFEEWCRCQSGPMGDLFAECQFRVALFNNNITDKREMDKQRTQLLQWAEEINRESGLYTNEHFQRYADLREQLITTNKLSILKENIQKQISLLTSYLMDLTFESTKQDVLYLLARINELQTEVSRQNEDSLEEISEVLLCMKKVAEDMVKSIDELNKPEIQSSIDQLITLNNTLKNKRDILWKTMLAGLGAIILGFAFVQISSVGAAAAFFASSKSLGAIGKAILPMGKVLLRFALSYIAKNIG